MPLFRQPSFATGEIAPSLHGRTDLALYGAALATCKNAIVLPHGAVTNRPGFEFVARTKKSEDASVATETQQKVRLLPFIFSEGQAYVLEVWASDVAPSGYIRIYARVDGKSGHVLDGGGNPIELATSMKSTDLPYLKYAQSGDTLIIVGPSFVPQVVTRLDHDSWTIGNYQLTPTLSSPTGVTVATDPNTPDATHPLKDWVWRVTALSETEESTPGSSATASRVVYPDQKRQSISWTGVGGAIAYNVYRGPPGDFGRYAGYVGSATASPFQDDGQDPDFSIRPPFGQDLFASDNPRVVAYFQQRLAMGSTGDYPQMLRMSRIGQFRSFDRQVGSFDDSGLEFTLASTKMDEIRNLVPLRSLLVLTAGAEWSVSGAGGALTPSSINAVPQSYHGSSWVTPVVAGNSVLFVPATERGLVELGYDHQRDGYGGREVTVLARHLFESSKLVDLAYAEKPTPIVWAVREDGTLLGMTYVRELEVIAWHRHETDGSFENVLTIPEDGEHGVYVVVKRKVDGYDRRHVERLSTRRITDVRLGVFLDASLSADGRNTGATTMTLNNQTGWAPGDTLDVVRSAGSFVATDVGDDIVIDPDGTPLRLRIDSITSTTVARAVVQTTIPAAYQNTATTDWAWARAKFSGLHHLRNREVAVLSDGNVIGTLTVTNTGSGDESITLPADERGVIVHVGLAYETDIGLLDLSVPGAELKGREKKVNRALVDVEASRGLWAGEDTDHLYEWQQRQVADSYGAIPLHTGLVDILCGSTWNKGGRAVLRQKDPLPLTVLGVTRDVAIGE